MDQKLEPGHFGCKWKIKCRKCLKTDSVYAEYANDALKVMDCWGWKSEVVDSGSGWTRTEYVCGDCARLVPVEWLRNVA